MKISPFSALLATFLFNGSALRAESAAELIRKGDVCSQKLDEAGALKCYLPAEKMEPANVALLVSIARQYRHSMNAASTDEDKQRFGRTAVEYSQRAVALNPNSADAQLALAISYGKILPFEGNRQKAEHSKQIKEAVDKALRLNPHNDLAWHVLGRWHKTISGLNVVMRTFAQIAYGTPPEATNEDAVKCFEKAIELNPNRLMHYIELGMTYGQMGETVTAKRYLEKGLAMPSEDKDDPDFKMHGREALAKLR